MRNAMLLLSLAIGINACQQRDPQGSFSLQGQVKNLPDQKVYLEQLFFSDKAPEVIDTASVHEGKFELKGSSKEEGMFRIRMEKMSSGFIFINDAPRIRFEADMNQLNMEGPVFHTRANQLLKSFILEISKKNREISRADSLMQASNQPDSIQQVSVSEVKKLAEDYHNYILHYIDTISDPVVAMFALGYSQQADPDKLATAIGSLGKRFPKHEGIAALLAQFNQYRAEQDRLKQIEESKKSSMPGVGQAAPDFTMNDTEGKPFSLSQLRGKYVLVDFWASWCGPCRHENPNVVAAYRTFSTKNFTVLGVSLDEDKDKWLKAISDDKLTWKHVSDLKGWSSSAVPLYGFDGIPYNVLIDPQGKIIATELRGDDLASKLKEVLK